MSNFREVSYIPINEEFYVALQQRLKKTKLQPTYVSATKIRFPRPEEWRELPSEPHETFQQGIVKRLTYRYVFNPKKPNFLFDFEGQAKRDIERDFDYVNLSAVEIPFDTDPKYAPSLVWYERTRVTKGSRTQRAISQFLLDLAKKYGLYQNLPARDFKRWLNNIYCLQATRVTEYLFNSPIRPKDATKRLSDENFLNALHRQSKGIIHVASKVLEKKGDWIFDGLVTDLGEV